MRRSNITQKGKTLGILLILVLLLFCFISGIILENMRKQSSYYMNDLSDMYIEEMDNRLYRISKRILLIMMEQNSSPNAFRSQIKTIKENQNELEVNQAIMSLKNEFAQYRWEYGNEFHFFLYFEELSKFIELDIEKELFDNETGCQKLINQMMEKNNQTYFAKKKWELLTLPAENYLYKAVHQNGVYLGCFIDVKSQLEPFRNIDLGKNGYVELLENNQVISRLGSKGTQNLNKTKNQHDLWKYETIITKKLKRAPFEIRISITNSKVQTVFTVVVICLFVLALIMFAGYGATLSYLRSYVLRPIRQFVQNLQKYEEEEDHYVLSDHKMIELEQADKKFRNMMRQIKKLKITLYEQELGRQKMEMDYLKLQIRPHFYLNCLHFIYSMLDMELYDSAKKMSSITAEYLQYLFRNGTDFVLIEEELSHIKNYLDILMLRYPEGFEYYIEQDDEVKTVEILPFLIQNFVENSVKHALSLDKKILISVTVLPEEHQGVEYVNIYISDTGNGFCAEILQKLQEGSDLMNKLGEHLGITNCIKRLYNCYGDKSWIHFANSPLGGATVDIHIPKKRRSVDEHTISR